MTDEETRDRLKTLISILISLAAVTGALTSWRGVRIMGAAGGADNRAITSVLDEAGTELSIASDVYGYQTAATRFLLHAENGRAIREQVMTNPDIPGRWLDDWQSEMIRARNYHTQLNADYLKNVGGRETFDRQKYHDTVRAETASQKAIDPAPFIQESEAKRRQGQLLIALNALFTAAIFFFTVALNTESKSKLPAVAIGAVLYLSGAGTALWQMIG